MTLANDSIYRFVIFAGIKFVVKNKHQPVGLPYGIEHILSRGNGEEHRLGLMWSEVHHVVGFHGNTNHIVGSACNIDALSDGRRVVREKRLCHLIANDAHLTPLVAVEFVDISAGNDSLGRHHSEEG